MGCRNHNACIHFMLSCQICHCRSWKYAYIDGVCPNGTDSRHQCACQHPSRDTGIASYNYRCIVFLFFCQHVCPCLTEPHCQINRQFSFALGTIYSQQGISDDPWTLKTDYLNLPLTINYFPVKGLGVYVGIEPGILLRDKAEIFYGQHSGVVTLPNVGEKTAEYKENYDLKYEGIFEHKLGAKRGVLALPIGVNYEFDQCVFGIKYSIGLGNAIAGPGVSCTHNVFQISLGYKINVFGDVKRVEYKKEKKEENKEQ